VPVPVVLDALVPLAAGSDVSVVVVEGVVVFGVATEDTMRS
jgi:hypothetical protein